VLAAIDAGATRFISKLANAVALVVYIPADLLRAQITAGVDSVAAGPLPQCVPPNRAPHEVELTPSVASTEDKRSLVPAQAQLLSQQLKLSPGITQIGVGTPLQNSQAIRSPQEPVFTPRQLDVLALLVQGKPNKTICRELNLAAGTIRTHTGAIFRTLGVSNRTQAVFAVSQLGIQLPTPRPKK